MEKHGGMVLTGENQRTCRKSCPSATLSTTNPTQTDPGMKLGLHGERVATNRLSYGMALPVYLVLYMKIGRLCPWTTATNRPTVHLPDDI
jgi:hypothetical protein